MKLFQQMLVAFTGLSLIAPIGAQASDFNIEGMNTYVRKKSSSKKQKFSSKSFSNDLATINKVEKNKVIAKLIETGKKIKKGWIESAKDAGLDVSTAGIHPIPELKFNYAKSNEISTYFIQEMLYRGFLANTRLGTTFAYNDKIINRYLENTNEVFRKIKKYLSLGIKFPLKGPIRHTTFKRLI